MLCGAPVHSTTQHDGSPNGIDIHLAISATPAFSPVLPYFSSDPTATNGLESAKPSIGGVVQPLTAIPQLHSNPSAAAKLYLDFDGHFEAVWGGFSNVTTPVYDRDGDSATFSQPELDFIHMAWSKVSEDYAPFNIDVTTEEPPELAPGVPESVANGVALRVAIGGSSMDWYGSPAGGVAYYNVFTNSIPNVVYVFPVGTGNGQWDGDVASHEAGHGFGLLHQSTYDAGGAKLNEYNPGNGTWAPIMGNTYIPVTTWHNGTSSAGATSYQDDMALLASSTNGFGFRADDHGDGIGSASLLEYDGAALQGSGIIGTNTDVDVWSFSVTTEDTYQLAVDPAAIGPNLDAVLELRDAASNLIAMASPVASQAAELLLNLLPGDYFVSVTKTAVYGWLGQYTLSAFTPSAGVSIAATEPLVVPERGTAAFEVSLATKPQANVTIPLTLGDPAQANLSTSSLTFTPANWNVAQTVTLSGVDDSSFDGDIAFSILTGTLLSADPDYSGLDPADVAAISTDHGYGGLAYWADRGTDLIHRTPLNGGTVDTVVDFSAIFGNRNGQYQPRGMAIDLAGGKMYWADHSLGVIQRANLDGSNAETILSGFGDGSVAGIALDTAAGKVYWTNYGAQKIQRANLDGSNLEDIVTLGGGVWDVELDTTAGKMYWTDLSGDRILRADLNGANIQVIWSGTALANPAGIALDITAGDIYWYDTSTKQILRANLDGTQVEAAVNLTAVANTRVTWLTIDLRSDKLYWVDFGNGGLYRASLDGSQVTRIHSGLTSPQQMVIVEPTAVATPRSGIFTSESGGATTFNVALTTRPSVNVTIPISSGDLTEGSTSVSSLTFTSGNWNVPQSVTVTGIDDSIADGHQTYQVRFGTAISSDPGYAGIDPADMAVLNRDNEVKFFVVDDATANKSFRYGIDGTGQGNTNLGSGNTAPRGVASTLAGDKTWVVDANRKVYVYRSNDGFLLGSWTAGTLANNAQPEGIATNGTDVWIVDGRSDKVYRYAGAAQLLSGSQAATNSFPLASGNASPKDIVTDGQSFWIVDDTKSSDKVFKYTLGGSLQGSWTIDSANKAPTGIAIDPVDVRHIWIIDSGTDRVYQYNAAASRISGSDAADSIWALATGNSNPQGIADPPVPTDPLASIDTTPISIINVGIVPPVHHPIPLPAATSHGQNERTELGGGDQFAELSSKRIDRMDALLARDQHFASFKMQRQPAFPQRGLRTGSRGFISTDQDAENEIPGRFQEYLFWKHIAFQPS